MLISLPRRPARYFSMTSANSGWSCSWISGTRAITSLHLETGRLHDRCPARELLANELPRRVRPRIKDRLESRGDQDALNLGVRHQVARRLADLIDDCLCHAGGSEQAVEVAGDHAGKTGFDRGRNIGGRLDAA